MKIILTIFILFLTPLFIFAADTCLPGGCPSVTLTNPIGDQNPDVNVMIGQIINGVLGIVGSLALVMFIYGGFTWMTAAGGNEKIKKGKDIIIWATMGLIVIFASYAIVNFVLTSVVGGT